MRILCFLSDGALAEAIAALEFGASDEVVCAVDYRAACQLALARAWDKYVVASVAGHSPSYPNGHVGARAALELATFVIDEVPRDLWPSAVTLVNASPDYEAAFKRLLGEVGIPVACVGILL